MSRLVVVSNRVAAPESGKAPAGGLAVGLHAALEQAQGVWFGWSGDVAEGRHSRETVRAHDGPGRYRTVTVDLSPQEYQEYYEEVANRALWPVFHSRLDLATFSHASFRTYRQVNQLFADGVRAHLNADDAVWVHDYHLFLVGRALRQAGVTAPLGFFLHTPFPPADMIRAVPWWRELMDGLIAYDLVGFQTPRDARNFADVAERELGMELRDGRWLTCDGRVCEIGAFPIGIDTARFAEMAAAAIRQGLSEQFAEWFGDRRMIIGVDRLDYSKGLDGKFQAFEAFLAQAPEHHGHVALLQIAAPSREDVPEYVRMREDLETLSGHINGRFTELDWVPLRYINKTFDQESIAALYRLSRVGLVTPLRDGMNMVAKEYVAAQDPADPGVLVLSEFSGAASELADALIVNPYDGEAVAGAIRSAVEMPSDERRDRHERLFRRLADNTIYDWSERFLAALETVRTEDRRAGRGP